MKKARRARKAAAWAMTQAGKRLDAAREREIARLHEALEKTCRDVSYQGASWYEPIDRILELLDKARA